MKHEFESIANLFDGSVFEYQEANVKLPNSSNMPIEKYKLKIPYMDNWIFIENEFGNHNMGHVELELKNANIPHFKVKSGNHFLNLIMRKKHLLKIDCADLTFKEHLATMLISSNLEEIAKRNTFEPEMRTEVSFNTIKIITDYHLEFNDKLGAIEALIELYKALINHTFQRL